MAANKEKENLETLGKGKTRPVPAERMETLLRSAARRDLQAVAVQDGDVRLTFGQLQQRSDRLAHVLNARGINSGDRVGVSLDRCADLIVALVAVWKAGAAYVPIDPHYPQERVAYLLNDSGIQCVLCTRALANETSLTSANPIYVDEAELDDKKQGALTIDASTEDPAYMIYTSGSTGKPKGVLVPHRALVNHGLAMADHYSLSSDDRVLQVASISFDVAAEEIYPTLLAGATVVLRPPTLLESFDGFTDFIHKERITVVNISTAFWHAWVSHLVAMEQSVPPSLRALIVGTEQASAKYLNLWSKLTDDRVQWFNSYGPTETTITSTSYRHPGGQVDPSAPLPIGFPIDNTQVHVLDEALSPVQFGTPGELYIGGAGVALGYFDRPQLTAERFIESPFEPGKRLYKTGDIVRQRQDSALIYVGRVDFQVKIRGYRIELGEIEALLTRHPDLNAAVVTAPEDDQGNKRLVACVVPMDAEDPPAVGALREFLTKELPAYMIPSAILILPDLPMTPNGKVDRNALPTPDWSRISVSKYEAPSTDVQKHLTELWSEILGIERIGIDDDFFGLGGHSLHAVALFGAISRKYGVDLPLAKLLERPTIAELALLLEPGDRKSIPPSSRRQRRASAAGFKTLVPLRKSGDKPPIFFASGTGGNVLLFHDLVSYMPADRPIYGLQFQGVDGYHDPIATFEEMAERHVTEIRQAHPNGPYCIGGYSGGSQVAFEIAQQLIAQGAEVSALIVVDMPIGLLDTESAADKVARQKEGLQQGGLKHLQQWIQGRWLWEKERWTLKWIRRRARLLDQPIPLSYRDRYMNEAWSRARERYVYKPYPGAINVFRTKENREKGDDLGWDQVAEKGIVLHDLPGAHHSIMRAPHVVIFAEKLAQMLEQRT